MRRAPGIAVVLVSLTFLCWVSAGVLWQRIDAAGAPTPGRDTVQLLVEVCAAILVFAAVGGVLVAKRPANPIGWIFAGSSLLISLKAATGVYADYGRFVAPLPLSVEAAWFSDWAWIPAMGSLGTFLPLLFPNGHPPTRRWRIVGWMSAAAIVASACSTAFAVGQLDQFPNVTNPFGAPRWARPVLTVIDYAPIVLIASFAASVASLVVRAARAGPIERAQIKWIAFAASFLPLGFAYSILTGDFSAVSAMLVFGPLAGVAVACAVAVQRYRLFDIDRIINRTVVYALLTAVLILAYVTIVFALGAVSRPLTGQSDLAVAGATLITAAVFQPLRRRIQGGVDRRFNRARYDAARTVEAFGSRLRTQTDLESLGEDLRTVVVRSMQPSQVALWIQR